MIIDMNKMYSESSLFCNNEDDSQKNNDNNTDTAFSDGQICVSDSKHLFCCMTVIGQIEGHYELSSDSKTTKYEHMIPKLVAVEEDSRINGLLVLLNTVGGDIEAGLAIAELIAGMSKPTVSLVLGGGHSIGVPLAVSAKKSFIAKTAAMTIHPVRINGVVLGVPQTFEYFRNIQERIVRFVCDNSKITADRFRYLMLNSGELVADLGTVLNGTEAVKEGIIDATGTLSDALDALKTMCDNKDTNQV